MSRTEQWSGKIKKIEEWSEGIETQEDKVECLLNKHNIEDPYIGGDWRETYYENFWGNNENEPLLIGDDFYEIIEKINLEYDIIAEASDNKDGSIDFVVSFYNGGMSFSEALEVALERLKEKQHGR